MRGGAGIKLKLKLFGGDLYEMKMIIAGGGGGRGGGGGGGIKISAFRPPLFSFF